VINFGITMILIGFVCSAFGQYRAGAKLDKDHLLILREGGVVMMAFGCLVSFIGFQYA